ncbi:MAG: hypothetical protein VXW23_04940, partial [Planctomycetota bacterium]|nr:hypothetical protein [Planctomycetota bacterium]
RVQAIAPIPDLIRFGLESLDPASFDVVDSPEAFQPGYDFTVWPAESLGDTVLPEGRHLVLGGVPGGLGIRQVNEQTAPAVVMATEALHPVMRGVGVGRLEILNAPTWKGSRGVTELMSGPSGGLVFAAEPVGRRVVAVGFDPMESNWPALPGFVAFLANTASWLAEVPEANAFEPGDVLRLQGTPGANAMLSGPGLEVEIPFDLDGRGLFWPLRTTGRYVLQSPGQEPAGYAVNRTDVEENLLGSPEVLQLRGAAINKEASGSAKQSIRIWILLVVLAVLVSEWWLWRRS